MASALRGLFLILFFLHTIVRIYHVFISTVRLFDFLNEWFAMVCHGLEGGQDVLARSVRKRNFTSLLISECVMLSSRECTFCFVRKNVENTLDN